VKNALEMLHEDLATREDHPPTNIKNAVETLHEDLAARGGLIVLGGVADRSAVVEAKSFLATLHEDLTAGREDRPAVVGVKTALATLHAEREDRPAVGPGSQPRWRRCTATWRICAR
jgi:hypothetical protein